MTFHLTCVHIICSSVWVAEWPPFCILTICNFNYFPFGFLGLDLVSDCFTVPGLFNHFYFF